MYKATTSHTLKQRYNSKRGKNSRQFTNFLQLADIPNVKFFSNHVWFHLSGSIIPPNSSVLNPHEIMKKITTLREGSCMMRDNAKSGKWPHIL
jgi:hypothetical protein